MTSISDRVDSAILANADNDFRNHLGASLIGRKCDLSLWLSFRWATKPDFSPRILRLFARGHREEPSLEQYLRDAGLQVFPFDTNTGDQFRISDVGQHFGGSMDGIGFGADEYLEQYFLLEYKTSGDKAFKQMLNKGVAMAKPEHYAQMQSYMYKSNFGLMVALYIMVNKNTDELYFEWVPFNEEAGKHFLNKARHIITSDSPPLRINESPSWFECKFCDQYKLCQLGTAVPEVNCRTCAHSTPVVEGEPLENGRGRWRCEHHGHEIDSDDQRAACDNHQFHPAMMDRTFEYLEDATYVTKDGVQFRNGVDDVRSTEVHKLLEAKP